MVSKISPSEARKRVEQGAVLVDIRDRDEYRRERIEGALNCPASEIDSVEIEGESVIFHCKSGMRTQAHITALQAKAGGRKVWLLEGGLDNWKRSGFPVRKDSKQPIEMQRQVMIVAGALVLTGVLLSQFVSNGYVLIAGFVGAGLMFAGITGFCGMANVLKLMPWNRTA